MNDQDWDGSAYQDRLDRLAARGTDMHGEVDLVMAYRPDSVLDAGCGTGRVGGELARRGVEVVGVDIDPSMLAVARDRFASVHWIEADLTSLDLGRTFDVVVLAGNVPLFTPAGTEAALVGHASAHVAEAGLLMAGFSLDGRYGLDAYDAATAAAGLELESRWATWDRQAWGSDSPYAVSVHRRPAPDGGPGQP